jgi:hypothetical protein
MNEISNWSDTERPRRSAAARSTAWPWVVGAAVIALAAVSWVGFSDRGGGQTSSAEMPPPQVTVSKPLLRDVDTRIGLLKPAQIQTSRRWSGTAVVFHMPVGFVGAGKRRLWNVRGISFAIPYEVVDEMIQAACYPLSREL